MLSTILLIAVGTLLVMILALWLVGERGRLLRPSTWKMMREGGLRRFLDFSSLHGYLYGRWTNQYLHLLLNRILPRLSTQGGKWLSDRYHGKVLTHDHARALLVFEGDIPIRDLEQVVPYPMARDLVLRGPPDLAVYECGCRHARSDPCQPTRVCMVVGQPFVDFVLEHNPQSSRRMTQREALELLEAEHERGHLHSAWFKEACLDRFYSICNCCKCCCGGIEAMTKHGVSMMASSGYVAQVAEDLCRVCGRCVDACAFGALSLKEKRLTIDWEQCMGCGVCIGQCPNQALCLVRDERKGVPLDVRVLAQEPAAVYRGM